MNNNEDVDMELIAGLLRHLVHRIDPSLGVFIRSYGMKYSNGVFSMLPDCGGCDLPECLLCSNDNYPNFIHNTSGMTVSWYKYIGRGMKVKMPDSNTWDLLDVFKECIRSIYDIGTNERGT
jgi:hypothetical protein